MEEVWESGRHILNRRPLSDRVREAFFRAPRHRFVDRFREAGSREWIELSDENLSRHLELIYRDQPLVIWGEIEDFYEDCGSQVSTISQPSFVLYQLDLLDLRPGQSVFELGTGSGWNAALMSLLCKPGRVRTYEIIETLAVRARERLKRMGFDNVEVIHGDGMAVPAGVSFERGIFTAGAADLPRSLHEAIGLGGRLLFVLQDLDREDHLLVLRKTTQGFVAEKIITCGFVPVTGQSAGAAFSAAAVLNELGRGERLRLRDLDLKVIRSDAAFEAGPSTVSVRQPQSTFLWTRK